MGVHCCAVLLPASCGLFLFNKGRFNMSDMWESATWNENGELVIDVYANPPDVGPNEFDETDEDFEYETDEELDENEPKHTYATIDCGGECGGCVALVVDDEVVSGPPFHPNCQCSLNLSDIENADYHDSHLHQDVASDRSVDTRDIKWLKMALVKLGYYTPDSRAGESNKRLNQYPNQRLFDAIENFRKENKIKETGAVKPGHWTEVKINEALKKERMDKMKISSEGISWLKGKEDKVLDKQGNHIIYDDKTGKPVNTNEPLPRGATIGYGHLIKSDEDFRNGINETTATELLRTDITTAEHAVKNNISVPLKQNQYDALVSLAYNIGAKNFANSTVVKYINNPNFHSSVYPNLESAWKAWNRSQGEISNGLINRRQNEWDLYNRGIY